MSFADPPIHREMPSVVLGWYQTSEVVGTGEAGKPAKWMILLERAMGFEPTTLTLAT